MSEADTRNTSSGRGRGGPGRHSQQSNGGPGRGNRRWSKQSRKQTFVGNTKEMNSQVFQIHTEQRKKGQFQDTMDQLLTYAATNYAKEIKHLKTIFTNLEEPMIEVPQPPSTRRALSSLEETILAEETKQYIKDK